MIFIFNWEMEFGIIGTHLYFPRTFVSMDSLARLNNTPIEKLKIGLGQLNMSFTYPMEDVNSLCMSAVHQLLSELGIAANSIGRLSVGTESAVDKSKGVKSYLMDLFPGNPSMEGVQVVNACYGGTEALFNCIDWLHSPAWDGRYALCVQADVAVYDKGPARCTGGAGAVCILLGPNPKIQFLFPRVTYMQNAYDFYKPDPTSEYPTVDGHLSIKCYLQALDHCQQ